MSPDDPRHGTYAGASQHWKDGERTCSACTVAASRRRKWNLYQQRQGNPGHLPSTGTIRRTRALMALGWSAKRIGEAAGISERTVLSNLYRPGELVTRRVADAIAHAYDTLGMTLSEDRYAHRGRETARRRGWPPPLAWDNIDDPDEQPKGVSPERRQGRAGRPEVISATVEEFDFLLATGMSEHAAAERLGVRLSSFKDQRRRLERGQVA